MRPLAIAMVVVIAGLTAATYFFVTGVTREVRSMGSTLSRLGDAAVGDDDPLSDDGTPRRFEVARGETAASIADRLEKDGFIKNALAFRLRARTEGVDVHFEAGEYELAPNMRPSEIMQRLQSGRFPGQQLTIPEGFRIAQIADAVEQRRAGARQAFLLAVQQYKPDVPALADRPSGAGLEGYLFPDTYEMDENTSMAKLVDQMVRTFAARLTPDVIARARDRGLNVHQLVTLASIVEREAQIPSERLTIAAVYLNRLKQNLPLQADPTVQFALRPTNDPPPDGIYWKRALTGTDLRVDSPYNTYQRRGLPPGPICSPGLASLQAVADAPATDLLYFVAKPDGSHAFARTLAEHEANVAKYRP